MSPIRSYNDWPKRQSNKLKQIEPYKRYYFICEGKNTERFYFEALIDRRKELAIKDTIIVDFLEKTGKDEDNSNPKSLIKLAECHKKDKSFAFDKKHDKMIIVFDADIFKNDNAGYTKILNQNLDNNNISGVTNPSFELFLLLHSPNAFNKIILPNNDEILANEWVGENKNTRIRYVDKLFRDRYKMNPKSNKKIGTLSKEILTAIEEEKKLNNDIQNVENNLTSNIGKIIEAIINDTL